MAKLKLKPAQRDNRRYFIFNSTHDKAKQAILDYIGIIGLARSAYMPVRANFTKKSIGSCRREEILNIQAALGLAGINIELISGTLKALEKKYKSKA